MGLPFILPMKKFPHNSRNRKGKPGDSERPSHASSKERAGQTHGPEAQQGGRREGNGQSRGPSRRKNFGSARRRRPSREVAVLYEDDAVIVLNKPAGLLAVPIKGSDVPSALSLLIAELKAEAATRAGGASY